MSKAKRSSGIANAKKINLDPDQRPPWMAELEPALQEQIGKGIWSPTRARRLAQVYLRWGAQLLQCADIMEVELDQHALQLTRGPWRAGDPMGN